jgi:hypothetical protein
MSDKRVSERRFSRSCCTFAARLLHARATEISRGPVTRAFGARPEGFEPPTLGLEVRCSIRLSYGRKRTFSE